MKYLRMAAWIGLIAILIWDVVQEYRIQNTAPGFHIVCLELAKEDCAKKMLNNYADVYVGHRTVLREAVLNTKVDFLFIICYVACFYMVTYHEMQHQKSNFFNALLRMNLLLCFVTGALDITENILLLFNFRHFHFDQAFVSTYWVALIKWILVGWMLLCVIVARLNRLFSKN